MFTIPFLDWKERLKVLQQLLNSFILFLQPANYFIILGGVAVEKVTCIDATKVSTRYEYLMNNLWFK